jgi:hypothetical protein
MLCPLLHLRGNECTVLSTITNEGVDLNHNDRSILLAWEPIQENIDISLPDEQTISLSIHTCKDYARAQLPIPSGQSYFQAEMPSSFALSH